MPGCAINIGSGLKKLTPIQRYIHAQNSRKQVIQFTYKFEQFPNAENMSGD